MSFQITRFRKKENNTPTGRTIFSYFHTYLEEDVSWLLREISSLVTIKVSLNLLLLVVLLLFLRAWIDAFPEASIGKTLFGRSISLESIRISHKIVAFHSVTEHLFFVRHSCRLWGYILHTHTYTCLTQKYLSLDILVGLDER